MYHAQYIQKWHKMSHLIKSYSLSVKGGQKQNPSKIDNFTDVVLSDTSEITVPYVYFISIFFRKYS